MLSEGNVAPLSSRRVAGFAVHAFTASGTVCAFLAALATHAGDTRAAFFWLAVAVAVDAVDGFLARLADVKSHVPEIDGARLDDIVDYMTFVLVPLFLLVRLGLLAGAPGLGAAILALLCSALRFVHTGAKTPDHLFTGFPSYWNVIALYAYVFAFTPGTTALLVAVLALLVLAPLRFIYPSRTVRLRGWSVALGLVWAGLLLAVIAALPGRAVGLATLSLGYPLYYVAASLWLDRFTGPPNGRQLP